VRHPIPRSFEQACELLGHSKVFGTRRRRQSYYHMIVTRTQQIWMGAQYLPKTTTNSIADHGIANLATHRETDPIWTIGDEEQQVFAAELATMALDPQEFLPGL